MSADGRHTINVEHAVLRDVAVASSGIAFNNDSESSFSGEVPEQGRHAERQLPDGTLDITNSAIEALVVGSKDAVIDKRGAKINIKIASEDDPASGSIQHTGTSSSNILINSVVDSSDTKICMEGARINIKRKKNKKPQRPQEGAGQINLTNSVAVGLVAYSERTEIDLKNSEINIE